MTSRQPIQSVLNPNSSPLVSFRLVFKTGSALDPEGKEGLAALTGALIATGGSRTMSYDQIVSAMYPMATSFTAQVDKEITVFYGTTHVDNLEKYYELIGGMLLDPGWHEDDFARVREDAINFLRVNLRGNNDEELGKELLYSLIYESHPYGHHNAGTIESLRRMTLDDVKTFHAQRYTRDNFIVGLAGGYGPEFLTRVYDDFAGCLSGGEQQSLQLIEPRRIEKLEMAVVKKDTLGTAISFGFPIAANRSHPDWPALLVAQSFLGQHRSSNSYLYQRLRQIRGLNYGDYAYIEYFPRGMFQFNPDPNLCRQQQIFQVWIRPVEPHNGLFALRAGLYELNRLVENGLSAEEFEATRQYLMKFVNLLTKSQDEQLGYAIDSVYYQIPPFTEFVVNELQKLTRDRINSAIKAHLQAENVKIVVVTRDAEGFVRAALEGKPSPPNYTSPPPADVLEEDRLIQSYKLTFNERKVAVVPVDEVFQK
jgi:zinc protease